MDENRLKHSMSVANKMVELNNEKNAEEVFAIGCLHDIGYQFTNDKTQHNRIGGEILKKLGFKFWKEVYYHGEVNCKYKSDYLNLLNKADMIIDSKGNDVGFQDRLEDIKSRYGKNSPQYIKAKQLIQYLEEI